MDSSNSKFVCYAHLEGHIDLCYTEDGSHLLTCGTDGDVRIWKTSDYEYDPASHRAGENVLALAHKDGHFYTAADDNAVRIHTFPDGQPDGIAVRFTAPVTHIVLSSDGKTMYAGAGDFHIKVVTLESSKQRLITGHDAPILSLALNPAGTLLASSSCDGTVRIWKLGDDECLKVLPIVPKSNHFSSSPTLCRMAWTKDGKHLAVPVGKVIRMYKSETWESDFELTDPAVEKEINLCALSPCGQFIAAGCLNGDILSWNIKTKKLMNREPNEKKGIITGLAWKPKGDLDLAYTDNVGYLGIISDFIEEKTVNQVTSEVVAMDYADLFDDNDDLMAEDLVEAEKDIANENDGASIADTKAIFGDDNSRGTDAVSEASQEPVPALQPEVRLPPVTPLQPAFQPGSTPIHLTHRFMIWNSVGVIRQYNTEEENSIDVEFHDTATHHAIHVTNTLEHSMAALSHQAVLLACEGDEDTPSQVVCMHFAAWDSSSEWSIAMPDGEEVEALTLGDGWAAVATDRRQLRLLTVGGVQREVFSLPGPVVCLAGHGQHLMVVYHRAAGLPGEQCLGVMLMQVAGCRLKVELRESPLPLTAKSTLVWAGFSAEGTPFTADSAGVVNMLNRRLGNVWSQVANTKSLCKGKSDHYWIVGVHENPAQIRAIMCKGSRYPPTLPRPNVNLLPFALPLCELSTDKGQLEEKYWKSRLLTAHLDHWDKQGYEVEESLKSRLIMPQQELLIKLFALACKTGREARAEELAELMSGQQAVQLAIKYASRLKKIQLAERLTDVARSKAEQEEEENGEEEQEREVILRQQRIHLRNGSSASRQEEEDVSYADDNQEEDENTETDVNLTPTLKIGQKSERPFKTLSASQGRTNPFKVQPQKPTLSRGTSVFDKMTPPQRSLNTSTEKSTPKARARSRPLPSKKGLIQESLMVKKSCENQEAENTNRPEKKSAFQLWMAANETRLQEENPSSSPADIVVAAAAAFKQLPAEEKQEWQEKASGQMDDASQTQPSGEKRKRTMEDSDKTVSNDGSSVIPVEKKKKLADSTNSKLALFSFNK